MPAPSDDVKSLQKQLLREISVHMPQYGFSPRIWGQSFRRTEPFGLCSLHISFISHISDFDVTADVGLRINAVEKVLNSENKLLSEKEKGETFTVGAELGNIAEGKQRQWTISNVHQLSLVTGGILEIFERVGLPYLNKISNLDYLLYVLSNHDREAWLASPIHEHRCKTIAVLARVLGKSQSRVQTLCAQCDNYLQQRNDLGLDSFRRFIRRIELSG
jgi:hypothetical protein